jgi:ABC-type dipeptide/oligopeptide/nickel transport system permease subunit
MKSQRFEGKGKVKRLNFSVNTALYSGIIIIGLLAMVAIAAPLLSHYDPIGQDLENTLIAPTRHHLLGTDQLGRGNGFQCRQGAASESGLRLCRHGHRQGMPAGANCSHFGM